jgi:RNA polymerase sigma factor (sigma-70 family)
MHDAAVDVDEELRFEATYRDYGARLWRSILLYAGDPEVASDAVAEAFAQAIRRGDEVREPLAWVTRAAFRIAAGELKARRGNDHPIVEVAYDVPEPTFELMAALHQLSPKQRAAMVLHFCDGYTLAEVADIIGSTTSAVSVHLHRARKRLRVLLGEDND